MKKTKSNQEIVGNYSKAEIHLKSYAYNFYIRQQSLLMREKTISNFKSQMFEHGNNRKVWV